ncbi:class II fructose-bisphosphatase [Pseudonocardia sp. GCM10023141]|uniref:class II fructose-bisphosphatase n=1 Tax=Pseudonocardia sp. GCM10023141 TaxID=3252653 RepID=UPI00361BBF78
MTVVAAADTDLAMRLVAVTEAAAVAAAHWVGRSDKEAADQAAVDAMRSALAVVPIDATIVIGEGEKDEAPMLHNGERVGTGDGPAFDIAVDPVDGTTLTAKGMRGAVAVLAASPRGTMLDPPAVFYMEKLVAGREAADVVDITAPVAYNVQAVARARGVTPSGITVCVLDRPRHTDLVREVCATGARVRLISDGDVVAALEAAAQGTGVDLLLGVGGTPEGIITACAVTCLGGVLQARLHPRSEAERAAAAAAGFDLDQVLTAGDLVAGGEAYFVMTGITDGAMVAGVRVDGRTATTESLVLDASDHSVRRIGSTSAWERA